jgi:mRNA-degrading endonuclease RelE of RelBE toxin-antitoxin system
MRDEWAGFWRIRVGVYRVVYAIGHPARVLITDVGPPSIYGRRRRVSDDLYERR